MALSLSVWTAVTKYPDRVAYKLKKKNLFFIAWRPEVQVEGGSRGCGRALFWVRGFLLHVLMAEGARELSGFFFFYKVPVPFMRALPS